MKIARFVLKIVALALAAAAAICCVIAFWDKIAAYFDSVRERLDGKKCCCSSEYDDYADWDE